MPVTIQVAGLTARQQHDAGGVRGQQDAADHRQEGQPAGYRAVALDRLQVVGEEQEDAEDRDPGQPDRDVGAAPGPVQDHPQRQQWVADPALGERRRSRRISPATSEPMVRAAVRQLGMRDPEDDCEQPGRGEHGSGPVHPRTGLRSAGPHVSQAPAMAIAAKNRLTYRVQRQEKYWVRTRPGIQARTPPAATDPKTPNARPRSRGSAKVLTSVPGGRSARMAPKAP